MCEMILISNFYMCEFECLSNLKRQICSFVGKTVQVENNFIEIFDELHMAEVAEIA